MEPFLQNWNLSRKVQGELCEDHLKGILGDHHMITSRLDALVYLQAEICVGLRASDLQN
jgi:hypothetical protein